MPLQATVRPGRAVSFLGFIFGVVFVGIGLLFVLPTFGAFGVPWTAVAFVITVCHGINTFSRRGIAQHVVDFDLSSADPECDEDTVERRLRRLESLRDRRRISAEEYEEQRQRILDGL